MHVDDHALRLKIPQVLSEAGAAPARRPRQQPLPELWDEPGPQGTGTALPTVSAPEPPLSEDEGWKGSARPGGTGWEAVAIKELKAQGHVRQRSALLPGWT